MGIYKHKITAFNGISTFLFLRIDCKKFTTHQSISTAMIQFREYHNPKLAVSKSIDKNAEYCQKYFKDFVRFAKEKLKDNG